MMRYKGMDYPYMDETRDGWKIIKRGMDKHGMLTIIVKRDFAFEPYVVGIGYSPRTGNWAYGHYFETKREAVKDWKSNVKYPDFDPNSVRDMDFERIGRYNFNHVSGRYLSENDYRDPGFDVYPRSDYESYYVEVRGEPHGREGFEKHIDRYLVENPNKKPRRKFRWGNRK